MMSRLVLGKHDASVLSGSYVIPSSANYQRFCSSFLATKKHGFERDLLFTNEEATDFVYRTGTAWPLNEPADPRVPEQAGVVVAYDVESGAHKTIYGMGRHNHENSVALPGYGSPAVLSGDDTFSAPQRRSCTSTRRRRAAETWSDDGRALGPRLRQSGGQRLRRPHRRRIGLGQVRVRPGGDRQGRATPLENWSNANNVFQFIRVEDIAYDRRSRAWSTSPTRVSHAPSRPRPGASAGPRHAGPYPNGRIFRLELDAKDPTIGRAVDPDRRGRRWRLHGRADRWAGPASAGQPRDHREEPPDPEDPGSQPAIPGGSTATSATTARIWRVSTCAPAADARKVDQLASTRVRTSTGARLGAWESSGIIDASNAFGPGVFLVDVQAPTLWLEASSVDNRGRSARLHDQARRRAAPAAPHSRRVANERGGSGLRAWPTLQLDHEAGATREQAVVDVRHPPVAVAERRRHVGRLGVEDGGDRRMPVHDARAAVGVEQSRPPPRDRRAASGRRRCPRRSSTEAASPSRAPSTVARATASIDPPSSRYAVVSAWTTSQSPSRASGGRAVIHSTCSGVSAARSESTPPFSFQTSWNDCPSTLVSSRRRTAGRRGSASRDSRGGSARLPRSRARAGGRGRSRRCRRGLGRRGRRRARGARRLRSTTPPRPGARRRAGGRRARLDGRGRRPRRRPARPWATPGCSASTATVDARAARSRASAAHRRARACRRPPPGARAARAPPRASRRRPGAS